LLPVSVTPVIPPNVPLPARLKLPVVSRTFDGPKKLILPVVALPSWSVCLLVVPRMPFALSDEAPVSPAEREAVGVPELTLVKANRALAVAFDPSNKSWVVFLSMIAPFAAVKGETVLSITQVEMPVTIPLVVVTQVGVPLVTPGVPLIFKAPTCKLSKPLPLFG